MLCPQSLPVSIAFTTPLPFKEFRAWDLKVDGLQDAFLEAENPFGLMSTIDEIILVYIAFHNPWPSKNFVYGSCSLKVDGLQDAFFKHNSNHALHNMTMLNAGLSMYLLSILHGLWTHES